jgi:hypothetical protein
VDFVWAGFEDGTFFSPFNTLAEGNNAVSYGGTLYFKSGTTSATTSFAKRMNVRAYGGPVTIGQ